jgi:hypothetical protein
MDFAVTAFELSIHLKCPALSTYCCLLRARAGNIRGWENCRVARRLGYDKIIY